MALVEFQNNMSPYINANNLNNNFEECYNIVESGSNGNGNWIKYSDGTMICYNRVTINNLAINNSYGSLYQNVKSFNFPKSFISTPCGICSEFKWGTSASWGTVNDITTTFISCRGLDVAPRDAGTNIRISWLAIGKWK